MEGLFPFIFILYIWNLHISIIRSIHFTFTPKSRLSFSQLTWIFTFSLIHFLTSSQNVITTWQLQNIWIKVSSVLRQKVHKAESFLPILNRNSFVPRILWISLYWNHLNFVLIVHPKGVLKMIDHLENSYVILSLFCHFCIHLRVTFFLKTRISYILLDPFLSFKRTERLYGIVGYTSILPGLSKTLGMTS